MKAGVFSVLIQITQASTDKILLMNLEFQTAGHMKHPREQETMGTTSSRIRFLRT